MKLKMHCQFQLVLSYDFSMCVEFNPTIGGTTSNKSKMPKRAYKKSVKCLKELTVFRGYVTGPSKSTIDGDNGVHTPID